MGRVTIVAQDVQVYPVRVHRIKRVPPVTVVLLWGDECGTCARGLLHYCLLCLLHSSLRSGAEALGL